MKTRVQVAISLFVFVSLSYANYSLKPFVTDTYAWYFGNRLENARSLLASGRFVTALLCYLVKWSHYRILAYLIEMIMISVAFYLSVELLRPGFRGNWLYLIPVLLPVYVNPLYCEWFPFQDAVAYTLGLVLSTGAAFYTRRLFFEDFKTKDLLMTLLLLILVGGCYQPVTEHYVVLCVMLILQGTFEDNAYNIKSSLKRLTIMLSAFIVSGVIQALFTGAMQRYYGEPARFGGFTRKSIERLLFFELPNIIRTGQSTTPRYYVLAITIALLAVFIITCIFEKRLPSIIYMLLGTGIILACALSPYYFISPEIMWVAPRTITVVYSIPGLILLGILMELEPDAGKNNTTIRLRTTAIGLITILAVVFAYRITVLGAGQTNVQYTDRYLAKAFNKSIEYYEKESGKTVQYLAFPVDEEGLYLNYPDIPKIYDLNVSAFRQPWSQVQLMHYATGRDYALLPMDEQTTADYFRIKELSQSSTYQQFKIYFDGNTAYIPIKYDW